jgi:catechol 2,3-dioxygenase
MDALETPVMDEDGAGMKRDQVTRSNISPGTKIGSVDLRVRDIQRSREFYENVLGMHVLEADGSTLALGVDAGPVLVKLQADRDAAQRPRGTTGLYHFAILLPDRRELAIVLRRLLQNSYPLQGASDHYVSEAVYLADPEGNGIEVYADRPKDTWFTPEGEMRMGTVALDVDDLLSTIGGSGPVQASLPDGTRMGHIHLHVADLEAAIKFYRDLIGFDLMMLYGPSAGFLSAGGYHHHIGLNTWAGVGAPQPPEGSTGLVEYSILVPERGELESIAERAGKSGFDTVMSADALKLVDPSGIGVRLASAQ